MAPTRIVRKVSRSPAIEEDELSALIARQQAAPPVNPVGGDGPSPTAIVPPPRCHHKNPNCNQVMASNPAGNDTNASNSSALDGGVASTPTPVPSHKSSGMPPGAIAGLVIAILIIFSLITLGITLYIRKRRATHRVAPSTAYIRSQRARAVAAASKGAIGGPTDFRKTNMEAPFMTAAEAEHQAPPPPFTSSGYSGSLAEKSGF